MVLVGLFWLVVGLFEVVVVGGGVWLWVMAQFIITHNICS